MSQKNQELSPDALHQIVRAVMTGISEHLAHKQPSPKTESFIATTNEFIGEVRQFIEHQKIEHEFFKEQYKENNDRINKIIEQQNEQEKNISETQARISGHDTWEKEQRYADDKFRFEITTTLKSMLDRVGNIENFVKPIQEERQWIERTSKYVARFAKVFLTLAALIGSWQAIKHFFLDK